MDYPNCIIQKWLGAIWITMAILIWLFPVWMKTISLNSISAIVWTDKTNLYAILLRLMITRVVQEDGRALSTAI